MFSNKNILTFLFLLVITVPTAHAQFMGYTSPQSVNATLATNMACTGSAQTFITGITPGFSNLGQTQHVISITGTGNLQTLQAEIDGIDRAGNVYRISDMLRLPAFFNSTQVYGFGFFPQIQVQVTCSPNSETFTLSYSGTSTAASPSVGSYQIGAINKYIFHNTPANLTAIDRIQTPFGNSAGTLMFVTSGTLPAGTSVSVQCEGISGAGVGGNTAIFQFNPPVTAGANTYPVPAAACPFARIVYGANGATASTFELYYVFNASGSTTGTYAIGSGSLGANAITEPAAGTSALTSAIDTHGVKNATLAYKCTAGTYSVNVQEYSMDPTLTTTKLVTPVSGIAGGTQGELYIGSEQNPSTDTGTLATPPAGVVRFPQPALAFSFTNAGGVGTCTAQLYLTY